jgi:glyoxylase-like metal-dependent hydrolase (beta-lactamase superfamily II)
VDTGLPNQLEALLSGIKSHGFSPKDINYIFVTHEHADHSGNVAPLLKINPDIKVYSHPACIKQLTDPAGELDKVRGILPKRMLDGLDGMEPVPLSSINYLKDGDVFDLGNKEKLRVIFSPGHQPSGIVILEEKNNGLFINDLIGNYFADADFSLILTPINSNLDMTMKLLKKLVDMPISKLFLGHFGIYDKPKELIRRVLDNMQNFMDIAAECVAKSKPDEIAPRITQIKIQEAKKLLATRGEELYEYTTQELIPPQSVFFAEYYLNLIKNKGTN